MGFLEIATILICEFKWRFEYHTGEIPPKNNFWFWTKWFGMFHSQETLLMATTGYSESIVVVIREIGEMRRINIQVTSP